MRHLLAGKNLALITTRQTKDQWDALVTRVISGHKSCARFDINTVFPLYLFPDPKENGNIFSNGQDRHVNLSSKLIHDLSSRLRLKFISDGQGDLKKTFGPEDVFHYFYGFFNSPNYRKRYAEFLIRDFPKVLPTSDRKLFGKLCSLGAEVVGLHLLESPTLSDFMTSYPVSGDNLVDKGKFRYLAPGENEPGGKAKLKRGRVYINQSQYFEGVPTEVWNYGLGGWQVCYQWLKDRRNQNLFYDEVQYYQKIVKALHETLRLRVKIDQTIEDHGGWPKAFQAD
jgi:predicted helicase